MITINVKNLPEVQQRIKDNTKAAMRSMEIALDRTADEIKAAVKAELPRVFDRPTPFTLNSLQVTKTQSHNMTAKVWLKSPGRMAQHYLVPQVEGGARRFKGFELALDNQFFAPPSDYDKLNQYGNISPGQIRQVLSVLGRAERSAGYAANITEASKRRNRKPRDYVLIRKGNKSGLHPGVYQRVQTAVGFGAKTKRTLGFGEWQKGKTVGKFSSAIRARGLKAVLLQIKAPRYRKRLPFYQIGNQVFNSRFASIFNSEFARRSGKP